MRKYTDTAAERAKRGREMTWIRRRHGVIGHGGRWLTQGEAIRLLKRLAAERRQRLGLGGEA